MFYITGNGGLVVVHCTILADRVGYTGRMIAVSTETFVNSLAS